ncbi:MAG: PASTA domain-containing protein, partial [Gammaproteobacteria bacterium]|nr:PASTA domain-containing protein [Gammaproteobacteria bacterium]
PICHAIISDIDLDGSPDILAGNTVYNADGSTKWQRADLSDGYNAVGNFDLDAFAEVVLVTGGDVYILEHDGQTKLSAALAGGSHGGAPTVGDFDSDGLAEIGVADDNYYNLFEHDLTLKWKVENDDGSGRTGSTLFDFENDGLVEIVYSDEERLYVLRGLDGKILLDVEARSPTGVEAPIVADVDNDGSAEIVAMASRDGIDQSAALFVLKAVNDNWVATRPIWNQNSYHVTNINLDGSIPAHEQPNWLTPRLNNFRQNQFLPEEENKAGDSFTYKANDGALDSNEASVYIDLLPANTAPRFVSTPLEKASAGFEYLYGAQAIDREYDVIVFALVNGPASMFVDPATGLVRWMTSLSDLGTHPVTLSVTDSKGYSSLQHYNLKVEYPLVVPDVVGDPLTLASDRIERATLKTGAISERTHPQVPAGRVIEQFPLAGSTANVIASPKSAVRLALMVTVALRSGPRTMVSGLLVSVKNFGA